MNQGLDKGSRRTNQRAALLLNREPQSGLRLHTLSPIHSYAWLAERSMSTLPHSATNQAVLL